MARTRIVESSSVDPKREYRAPREAGRHSFDHGTDVCIGGNADHGDVDQTREFFERARGGDAEFRAQGPRLVGAAIPHGREQPRLVEVPCHGSAHGTEARKSDALHRRGIIRCGRGK